MRFGKLLLAATTGRSLQALPQPWPASLSQMAKSHIYASADPGNRYCKVASDWGIRTIVEHAFDIGRSVK